MTVGLLFADATASYDVAKYVILGIAKDSTGTHRRGTGKAPEAIRRESYNFETYIHDLEIDLEDIAMHDLGDIPTDSETIRNTVGRIIADGKVPIMLGGEHSVTPAAISAFVDVSVLVFDAHLDFRDDYEGDPDSHACATRRVFDLVGSKRLLPVGIRSIYKGEKAEADELGLEYVTADEANDLTTHQLSTLIQGKLGGKLYISLDMDAVDPAHAPGVGTPEPFGLDPRQVRDVIRSLALRSVGFDVVEVCPPFDHGNTASLAAKLVRDFIASRECVKTQ